MTGSVISVLVFWDFSPDSPDEDHKVIPIHRKDNTLPSLSPYLYFSIAQHDSNDTDFSKRKG